MNSLLTDDFLVCFAALPEEVRERARQAYRLWRDNPDILVWHRWTDPNEPERWRLVAYTGQPGSERVLTKLKKGF